MPGTFKDTFTETASVMARNSFASFVGDLTQAPVYHQTAAVDDPEEAELAANILAVMLAPMEVAKGLFTMGAGVVMAVIPQRKIRLDSLGVASVDKDTPISSPTQSTIDITGMKLVKCEPKSLLRFTSQSETFDCENDHHLKEPEDVDEIRLRRPFIPGYDAPPPVIDHATRKTPVAYTKSCPNIGGVGLFSAGLSNITRATSNAVSGTSSLLVYGAQSLTSYLKGPGNK